jgi:predicted permease
MLLNLMHAGEWLPTFVTGTAHLLGAAAIPLGLLLSGASFADLITGESLRGGMKTFTAGALMRLGLLPVLFLLAAHFLPVSLELKRVLIVQAAMPSAIVPIILTRHYGGDTAAALRVVLGTTLLALLTLPWWLRAGLALLGHG